MKIHLSTNKKKNSMSVRFSAGRGREGVDLKDALLAMADGKSGLAPLLDVLKERGYESSLIKETPTTKDFELTQTPRTASTKMSRRRIEARPSDRG